jgi:hypothetical protein
MTGYGTGPAAEEIEVTLLGPGYGESIVVHATNGFWIVIDSCVPRGEKVPAPLAYLNAIGVDLSLVRFVVATHWHDDHVRGLAQLFEMSPNARLVLASALGQREFFEIAAAFGNRRDAAVPGASEIAACFQEVMRRAKDGRASSAIFAAVGKVLWDRDVEGVPVRINVLSPSDTDVTEAVRQFSAWRPLERAPVSRIPPGKPNHTAMAIQMNVGTAGMLFGADLERTSALDSGWDAVIDDETRVIARSSLYKVAHHGSFTGEHPAIWENLLDPAPLSLITPFRRGRVRLPKETDRQRILSRSGAAWITSPWRQEFQRTRPEQRQISKRAENVQIAVDSFGALQCRKIALDPGAWRVRPFGAADLL